MTDKSTPEKKTAKNPARLVFSVGMILLVILCDQITKWMVTELIVRPANGGQSIDLVTWITTLPSKVSYAQFEVLPFYNTVMVWNYGVSFGLFNNHSTENALLLVAISLVITLILLIWMFGATNKYVSLGLALAIGGAFGNIIDRVRFGAVIDYIDIHAYGYHWPAFNVADSAIVVGIGIVIIQSLFFEKRTDK